jgi:hypothetical protein
MVSWFEKLTGFPETTYTHAQDHLYMDGTFLVSKVNGHRYDVGTFKFLSVAELRQAYGSGALPGADSPGDSADDSRGVGISTVYGDVGHLHTLPEYNRALFQVCIHEDTIPPPPIAPIPPNCRF